MTVIQGLSESIPCLHGILWFLPSDKTNNPISKNAADGVLMQMETEYDDVQNQNTTFSHTMHKDNISNAERCFILLENYITF